MPVKICRQRWTKGKAEGRLEMNGFVLRPQTLGWAAAGVCGLRVGLRKKDGGVKKRGKLDAVMGGRCSMFDGVSEGNVPATPMMLVVQ